MIRAMLLSEGGIHNVGGAELVQTWHETPGSKLWLDIDGDCTDEVRELLRGLDCDELSIKDSFRTRHPPKVEEFEANTFLLFRGMSSLDDRLELVPQQIGMWAGIDSLVTVHRGNSVSIEHFWDAEATDKSLLSPNVLALHIFHYASGRYLEKLLGFEDRLSQMEDGLLSDRSEDEMKALVGYRSRLRKLKRIFNYHHGLAEFIWKTGTAHLGQSNDHSTSHIRRDVYDRCERNFSLCNLYYEQCGDLVEGYISLSSHKLNNTMKILTIITAIFVPMGFLAGLYGMNFDNMPELHWEYSYFVVLFVMAALATTMLVIFKRSKWL